jgi:hypothetical protein
MRTPLLLQNTSSSATETKLVKHSIASHQTALSVERTIDRLEIFFATTLSGLCASMGATAEASARRLNVCATMAMGVTGVSTIAMLTVSIAL